MFDPVVSSLETPLSVLDLAPVGEGSTPTQALRSSLVLAAEAERLGYRRYWVAEHHNMPGIASSSPPVLLAHAAGVTETIRLGSGGVMLPNHASLVVAEQFGMLEALHPGRIDLGIGRAPGTDQLTARALRRSPGALTVDDFPEQLVELMGYFTGEFPEDHPYARITAVPGLGYRPALWLLGSSDYSARAAGLLGLPFSFAHHFAAANTEPAIAAYRSAFRPSDDLDAPYVMLGVSVVCAETDEEARYLAGSGALAFLRLRSGRPGRYPTPEEAAGYRFTPHEREAIRAWTGSHIVGSPDTVRAGLAELAERTGADELMLTTLTHSPDARLTSYRLVAEAAGVQRPLFTRADAG
ncbi:MAG TPA: LLM class flavin-dependent oxidoreductase [Acidimicrobiales bacterium]|nr:LLM class flavin-dependent oxidoreductase [Acidimicrobiales bacterium]